MEPENHIQSTEQRRSILVVTNDGLKRKKLEWSGKNFKSLTAEDTAAALQILLEDYRMISAVVFDVRPPERDGVAFLQQVRKVPQLRSVPILMVSDGIDAEEEAEMLDLGANDYIRRPVPANVVVSRIRNLIQMQDTVIPLNLLERDDLTGVYNRQAFIHHAQLLLEGDTDTDYDMVIADIDKFKLINAIYGEVRANQLLQSLAAFLEERTEHVLCGRYGSDRFCWLQKSQPFGSVEALLSDFLPISPVPDITVRFGVYAHVDRKLSMIRMCDNALLALKSIKTDYVKTVAYYDGPVSQRHFREQLYAAKFPEAIKNREFVVWYQPKYDPITQKVVGSEALVRWKNPDGSFNMPGEFLGTFEANGMISQLDEYVFREVCRQQKKWKDAGIQLFPVSVNLSRNSMHRKNLAEVYAGIAQEYGIPLEYLPIEITETTATDSLQIQKYVQELHQVGFPLHMDDFGSEHSSLQTLNVLDFDVVKLDKGLVDYIGDKEGELVLTYTMALAGELGLRIVAEGVECQQQLDFLRENGCDQIQGYYYSRPLPIAEFEQKVTDNLGSIEQHRTKKENLFILSRTSHFEKMMTQRMLPRIPGGFLIYEDNASEQIIYSNAYLWKLFGCEDEAEFMSHVQGSFRGVVCPEQLDAVERSIQQQIAGSTDDMDYVEYDIIRKDGSRVPVVDYGHLERVGKTDLFYVFIYKRGFLD